MFPKLGDALGVPEAKSDPRFATSALRCENHAAVKFWMEQILAARTAAEWLRDLQVNAPGMLSALPLPNGKALVTAGCPVHFVGDPPQAFSPAPGLDQDREALLKELGV